MTQKIFDTNNAEDMALLWSILPDGIIKISPNNLAQETSLWSELNLFTLPIGLIKINWHDKTEIIRPMQECTEQDIGKICVFYDRFDETDDESDIYAVLHKIENQGNNTWYYTERGDYYAHCRRLTKQEIGELC